MDTTKDIALKIFRNADYVQSKDEEGICYAEIPELGIVGVGENPDEAKKQLLKSIEVAVLGYLWEDDAKLTDDAKKFKRKLKKFAGI